MAAENDEPNGEHVYDWWSRHPKVLKVLYDVAFLGQEAAFRQQGIETLDPTFGERILEVGCGNGNSFVSLRDAPDSNGALTLVGLDIEHSRPTADRGPVQQVLTGMYVRRVYTSRSGTLCSIQYAGRSIRFSTVSIRRR